LKRFAEARLGKAGTRKKNVQANTVLVFQKFLLMEG